MFLMEAIIKNKTNDDYLKWYRLGERIYRCRKLLYLIRDIEKIPIDYLTNEDYNDKSGLNGCRPMLDNLINHFINEIVNGCYA